MSRRPSSKRARDRLCSTRSLLPLRVPSSEHIGSFPPNTLLWVLCEGAPIWPARVLARKEALASLPARKIASRRKVSSLSSRDGVAVRFFGDHTVALVEYGAAVPFVAVADGGAQWVWDAGRKDGVERGWGEGVYNEHVQATWKRAVRDAGYFMVKGEHGKEAMQRYGRLGAGTLVWGLCGRSPFWPAVVIRKVKDGAVRVRFFGVGQEGGTEGEMSLIDLCLFLPGEEWRAWMIARGEAEMKDRHWGAWKDVEGLQKACEEADEAFREVHGVEGIPFGRGGRGYEFFSDDEGEGENENEKAGKKEGRRNDEAEDDADEQAMKRAKRRESGSTGAGDRSSLPANERKWAWEGDEEFQVKDGHKWQEGQRLAETEE